MNYRTPALTVECLESISESTVRPDLVIVVDNDSQDRSFELLSASVNDLGWSGWVRVLQSGANGGFGAGNNVGVRCAVGCLPELDCIVLLNPDATADPRMMEALLNRLWSSPCVGIVGASIVDASHQPESAAHNVPSPLGELERSAGFAPLSRVLQKWAVSPPQPAGATPCGWVSGACMAIRREVFDQVGGFDEGYFLYFEEVDLCVRAARLGWQCWYEPAAQVMHRQGAATGISVVGARLPAYWYESRRRLFVKAHGVAGLLFADALWCLGHASLLLRRALGLRNRLTVRREPALEARDLLLGDVKALFDGTAFRIPRLR